MIHDRDQEKGIGLIEVLLAVALFAVGVASFANLFLAVYNTADRNVKENQAMYLAREGMEAVRSIRDSDPDGFMSYDGEYRISLSGQWNLVQDGSVETIDEFERSVQISGDDESKQVSVWVEWGDGEHDHVDISEHMTAWRLSPDAGALVSNGLVVHLDAEQLSLANNDPVDQWDDISGNGNHASQSVLAEQPIFVLNGINGNPSVVFDGSDDFMSITHDASLDHEDTTVFMVLEADSWNPVATLLLTKREVSGDGWVLFDFENQDSFSWDWGGDTTRWNTSYRPANDPQIINVNRDNLGRTLYVDSVLVDNTSDSGDGLVAQTTSDLYLGRDSYAAQYWYSGMISEILIYDRALDSEEREDVEQYLTDKWM